MRAADCGQAISGPDARVGTQQAHLIVATVHRTTSAPGCVSSIAFVRPGESVALLVVGFRPFRVRKVRVLPLSCRFEAGGVYDRLGKSAGRLLGQVMPDAAGEVAVRVLA